MAYGGRSRKGTCQSRDVVKRRQDAHRLTENLSTLVVIHNRLDLLRRRIRFHYTTPGRPSANARKMSLLEQRTNLELTLHPLLVLRAVLLLDRLVILDRLHKLLLHQSRLVTSPTAYRTHIEKQHRLTKP